MSEVTNHNAAGAPTGDVPSGGKPPSPSQPESSAVSPAPEKGAPSGGRTVSDAEWAALSKAKEERDELARRVAGASRFYDAAKSRGFGKPEDFGVVDRLKQVAEKRGVSFDKLADYLALGDAGGDDDDAGGGKVDPEALAAMAAERAISAVRQEQTMAAVKSSHESALGKERTLIESAVSDILGKNASEADTRLVKQLLAAEYTARRQDSLYPEDHPLASQAFKPLGDAEVGEIKKAVSELLGATKGRFMEKVADAASKGGTANPQGRATRPNRGGEPVAGQADGQVIRRGKALNMGEQRLKDWVMRKFPRSG